MTPKIPAAARSSAMSANKLTSIAFKRGCAIDWHLLVDFGHGTTKSRSHRSLVNLRPHKDRQRLNGKLRLWNINLRLRRNIKTDQVHIAHHADDFANRRFARLDRAVWNDPLADRIFAREKLLRKSLVHN